MRFRPAVLAALLVLLVLALPSSAQAAGLFVTSQRDPTANAGITGLIGLSDGGGETQAVNTGGFRMAGTGVGPIVYSSGVIKQYNGAGGYSTLVPSAGGNIRSMTVTGRGLLVADGGTLKLRSGSGLAPALPAGNMQLPGGKLPGSDVWISITTLPDGHVLGWSFNDGYGKLYDIELSSGAVTFQDYSSSPSTSPFLNNRDAAQQYYSAPVNNSGGISADGQGGVWVASAGIAGPSQPSSGNQVYYAPPGSLSFGSVASGYTNPQIASTGTGEAYVTSTDGSDTPFFSDVYKVKPDGEEDLVTSPSGDLTNSRIDSIVVDRCYASCTVTGPDVGGGGGGAGGASPAGGGGGGAAGATGTGGAGATGTTSSPLTVTPSTASVTSKGLAFKLKCAAACSVSVSGKLVYGKASSSASTKLAPTRASLKAGKSATVVIKLSKGQRKAIKKARKAKRKVTARVKVVVKPKGAKSSTRTLKLKVK